MQKRIFLAISLPEDIKKRLFRFVEKEYAGLPVRWGRRENFHLTLEFLGYAPEESLPEICEAVREAVQNVLSFELEFRKIEIGPSREKRKMIWASGEKSPELGKLRRNVSKALRFCTGVEKELRPHITLGRIRKKKWTKLAPEPEIERNFVFSVPVGSVELFESKFEKGNRVYYVLESFSLK